MSGPIHSLFDVGAQLNAGSASLRHLKSLGLDLGLPVEPLPQPPFRRAPLWRRIRLEGVVYAYADAAQTDYRLGPIDLQVNHGETLFICGGNGSGKSTLLLILCGLLAPQSGTITVDGHAVEGDRLREYRNRFSAVFFDFTLFRRVIDGEARPAASAEVAHWLQRVELEEKVAYHDGALSTVDLSQGQRKRLALLQSCLDARDILIFDEITADQDREFRDRFYLEILPELKRQGRTVILVTHDDRYWHHADRLVVLDCGRAQERQPQSAVPAGASL